MGRVEDLRAIGQYMRRTVLSRLHSAMSMSTTADLERAAQFLEFANDQKRGKREQRAISRVQQRQRQRSRAAR